MSSEAQAYIQYRNSMVETASPGKLLLMLFDGAIRRLEDARKALSNNDLALAHNHLVRVQDIIHELMCTLNMDYEISKNLFSLYEYLYNQTIQANIKKDIAIIDEVLGFLTELKTTWQEAVKKAAAQSEPALKAQKPREFQQGESMAPAMDGNVPRAGINIRG